MWDVIVLFYILLQFIYFNILPKKVPTEVQGSSLIHCAEF